MSADVCGGGDPGQGPGGQGRAWVLYAMRGMIYEHGWMEDSRMQRSSLRLVGWLAGWLICVSAFAQPVKLGVDVLREGGFEVLRGKRVGLVAHPASRDSRFVSTVDVLRGAGDVELVALFGPEHGVYGDEYAGDKIADRSDPRTGLPAYSLYGDSRKPTEAMLEGLDVLVFDLQDIGARSYTYISTMRASMEACAEAGVEFVVLDRPNPLGGERIEGGLVEEGFESFISHIAVPYVHGMTMGELAQLVRDKYTPGYEKLTVIKMSGWGRDMRWEDTGLKWVMTSPHIPDAEACAYYVATGIVGELFTVSIGVGYTQPFELFGAPGIDGEVLGEALNDYWKTPGRYYGGREGVVLEGVRRSRPPSGVRFRPVWFKPFYSRFAGEVCQGVQVYLDLDKKVNLVEINFKLAQAMGGEFIFGDGERDRSFDIATGTNKARLLLMEGAPLEGLFADWRRQSEAFRKDREKYLLYPSR
jgi:uncharacterized protein YbbC (DUF1343 family)